MNTWLQAALGETEQKVEGEEQGSEEFVLVQFLFECAEALVASAQIGDVLLPCPLLTLPFV
jgi:hypothetical protein